MWGLLSVVQLSAGPRLQPPLEVPRMMDCFAYCRCRPLHEHRHDVSGWMRKKLRRSGTDLGMQGTGPTCELSWPGARPLEMGFSVHATSLIT